MQTATQYAREQIATYRPIQLRAVWYGCRYRLTGGGSLASHRPYMTRQEADRAVAEVLRVARYGARSRLALAA